MPFYDMVCDNCGDEFEHSQSIHDELPKICLKCNQVTLRVIPSVPIAVICRPDLHNAKEMGQVAEINAKRLGKEQMELKAEQLRKRRKDTLKLPRGAKKIKPTDHVPWWRSDPSGKMLDLNKAKNDPDYKELIERADKSVKIKKKK